MFRKERINVDIEHMPYEKARDLFYEVPAGSQFEKELLERMTALSKQENDTDAKNLIAIITRNKKLDL